MKMNKNLEYIANGIHAANKISGILDSSTRSSSESAFNSGTLPVIYEILQAIVEYSPGSHRGRLQSNIEKSRQYIDTYKELKQHVGNNRNKSVDRHSFMKTLSIIRPVARNDHKMFIEKILKIYEILNS